MTPEAAAHFAYATKYKRWQLLQKRPEKAEPEKAEPGEIERLRKELGL